MNDIVGAVTSLLTEKSVDAKFWFPALSVKLSAGMLNEHVWLSLIIVIFAVYWVPEPVKCDTVPFVIIMSDATKLIGSSDKSNVTLISL